MDLEELARTREVILDAKIKYQMVNQENTGAGFYEAVYHLMDCRVPFKDILKGIERHYDGRKVEIRRKVKEI